MKNVTVLILFALMFSLPVIGQNEIARAYYIKAREAYASENYKDALQLSKDVEEEMGSTNPDLTYLKLMSRYHLDKRDPKIKELSMEFINSARKDDKTRIQEVSLIAVEHKQLLENDEKSEQHLYDRAIKTRKIEALHDYIQKYPENVQRIKLAKQVLQDLDHEAYLKAKNKNDVKSLESYTTDFPEGKNIEEIKGLLVTAREEKLYLSAKTSSEIDLYKSYKIQYPKGKYIDEVNNAIQSMMLASANDDFENEDYTSAKLQYERFLEEFPESDKTDFVGQRLKSSENTIKREENVAGRTNSNHFMLTYGSDETYGFQFGKMHLRSVGLYFNLRANTNIGNLSFTEGFESEQLPEGTEEAALLGSLGLTFKVYYPIWIYAGAGAKYYELYIEDENGDANRYSMEGEEAYQIFPEAGLLIKIGKFAVIKGGASFIDGETVFQAGIGFQTKNW